MRLPLQSLLRFWPHVPTRSPAPAEPQAAPPSPHDPSRWRRIIGLLLSPFRGWRVRPAAGAALIPPRATDSERARELARYFDRKALGYDGPVLRMLGRAELAALEKLLPGKCAVLDYGCGAGRFSLPLALLGYEVTGFDASPHMAACASERGNRRGVKAHFTSDREALDGNKWPLVVCMGVLDYYRDPAQLLEQVAPCLAPRGRLIVGAPNVYGPLSWAHKLFLAFSIRMYMFRGRDIAAAGRRFGLTATRISYALPAIAHLGMTVLVAFDNAV